MVAKERHLGCPPNENEVCGCGDKRCGKMKYVQPPVRKSFKPDPDYQKPSIPMESKTVYKNSYFDTSLNDTKLRRTLPILPTNSIEPSGKKMDENTITALSFPGHTEHCKREPIFPHARSMLGTGPMQDYTTQKHDYVAKPSCKRGPLIRDTSIKSNDAPMENDTVQKLSFLPPDFDNYSRVKSFRPFYSFKRPDVPMEASTTQKLSYLPVSPPIKEELPWAKRCPLPVPNVPFEQCTTYKLSYIPSSGDQKAKPLRTKDNRNIVTCSESFEDNTIYKESFFGPGGYYKRAPILPTLLLHKSDAKMNPDTVYNLSFPGHSDVKKRGPILPHSRYLLGSGPLDDMTTQKRDFVDKPWCRRGLIIPPGKMEKLEAPFEKETTMKLSYLEPGELNRVTSFRPTDGVKYSDVPMENKTIQKLSFIPVTPPKKEEYPWAIRKLHSTDIPMDFHTTQHLSFLPPGQFQKTENGCICSYPGECMADKFPKADSY